MPEPSSGGWITGLRSPLRPDDHAGSFTVKPDSPDDPGAYKDFATGDSGSMRDLARKLGLLPDKGGGGTSPPHNTATLQHPPGCTLEQYAEEKRLPIGFLKSLGLAQINYTGAPAVRIPHHNPDGIQTAVLFRVAASGPDAKRWKSGSKATLYGLDRLHLAREAGYLVIVEGQSDCHTLWYHGIPAIGLPGASNGWDKITPDMLEDIETVYVLVEPDLGGEAVLKKVAVAPFRDRVRVLSLSNIEDPSAFHVDDPAAFRERWDSFISESQPWSEIAVHDVARRTSEAWAICRELAESPDILSHVVATVAELGVAGADLGPRLRRERAQSGPRRPEAQAAALMVCAGEVRGQEAGHRAPAPPTQAGHSKGCNTTWDGRHDRGAGCTTPAPSGSTAGWSDSTWARARPPCSRPSRMPPSGQSAVHGPRHGHRSARSWSRPMKASGSSTR